MKVVARKTKISTEERETILNYSPLDKKWYADTTVMTHYRKFLQQGWTMTKQYVYLDDGSVFGGEFEAPLRAITIRNTEKRQMSEKQLNNLNGSEEEEDEDE